MPYAIFDYMGAFLRSSFAHVDNVIPVIKTITWLLLSRLQGNKPHRNSPEPSEPCLRNLHQHAPELSRTLRNLPKHSVTNLSEPSGTYLNLRQHTPEPSGTFRNLPPEPSPFYTGTRLRNLHQHTPELFGTLRNLPEPSSGTCSCDPHRHTPELIWAEDPISLRWGKMKKRTFLHILFSCTVHLIRAPGVWICGHLKAARLLLRPLKLFCGWDGSASGKRETTARGVLGLRWKWRLPARVVRTWRSCLPKFHAEQAWACPQDTTEWSKSRCPMPCVLL